MRIGQRTDLDRAQFLQRLHGKVVFTIKVGRDDEETVFIESLEGLVEDFCPDRAVIPEILVPEEGKIGRANFAQVTEAVSPVGDEVSGEIPGHFGEFLFPKCICLIDLGGPNVEPLKVGGLGLRSEHLGQHPGLVAPPAGHIEQREVFLTSGQMGGEQVTQILLEGIEILL